MINNQKRSGHPLGRTGRVLLIGWSLFLTSGFVVAYQLQPDRRGYGTHQQLGLPGCVFRSMTGFPCPSCGMTTSFSHFTRGHLLESARANFAGLLLAIVCAVGIPWCWLSVYTGSWWRLYQPDVSLVWLLLALCGVSGLQWLVRFYFG